MPLYEFYCEKCDNIFESLRSIKDVDVPTACPACGGEAYRIMPTTFASMSHKGGWAQRVPFHHAPVRAGDTSKRARARAKPKDGEERSQKGKRKKG